jgi:putative peptidoglycan lipid II flippase
MRGGLTITAGILVGNIQGFGRSGVTAYLLGTRVLADGLAVALGPIDTLNFVLINTMIFAFVPLLTARQGGDRAKLFLRAARLFTWVFCSLSAALIIFAPWLIRVLGPGLEPSVYDATVNLLRITSVSTLAAGAAALQSALLYTERRFGPSAFYQAVLNVFVIVGALVLWRPFGIYGFAIGYTVGAFVQLGIVWWFARRSWRRLGEVQSDTTEADHSTGELLAKPGSFLVYAGLLALNILVTRAYATQAGPGMAAAFDYCIRCVNVVIAYLVSPVSNSLLPEIARLRRDDRAREAFNLMNRTLGVAAAAAVLCCLLGIAVRNPIIAILFQRGSFTAESTRIVAGVFLGFAPSLIGLSLLEIAARALFAMDRPWLPVLAAAVPVSVNLIFSLSLRSNAPEMIGAGCSIGLLAGFLMLVAMMMAQKKRWLIQEPDYISNTSK